MNKRQEEQVREALKVQRAEIVDEMARHGGVLEAGATADLQDPEDRAASLADILIEDRVAANDGKLLEKIDLALQRLDEGTYDVCADCKGPIPVARLLAKPSVSLCVKCQEAKESG